MSEDNSAANSNPPATPQELEQNAAQEASAQLVTDSQSPASSAPAEAAVTPAETTGSPIAPAATGGPISLDRIRQLRQSQQKTAPKSGGRPRLAPVPPGGEGTVRGKGTGKPASAPGGKPAESQTSADSAQPAAVEVGVIKTQTGPAPKISVPSRRAPLSQDLEDELSAVLGGSDLEAILVGDSSLQVGHELEEGQRIQGRVVKTQEEFTFVSLGGANEGMIPTTSFETAPEIGAQVEVVVRGFLQDEGLYELIIPGSAVEVSDWGDLNEGEVIEVLVTAANAGGLECKAGAIRGFIPASQAAEYRIENLADLVDQKLLCVVTEANPRRGNLVLSHRALLEREKSEKREERLAALEVGAAVDGTVTKIMDFGAFVDIGGLDGLLHVSQLSWDRVSHPREVVEEGQKIQVRIDKIDKQSGKIGLSYRALQENPWTDINDKFPVGTLAKGTVSRIAEFGAFVKLATGVEGLVHLSELAHHRVHKVDNVVSEGQEIDVKVLSIDEEKQRIGLSIKAAQAAPESAKSEKDDAAAEEPPAKPVLPKHQGPLKGGTGSGSGGEQFGLKW